MKKIINILLIMIAAIISMQSFSIVNEKNFYYISGIPDHIAQTENAETLFYYLEFPTDTNDGVSALLEYCETNNQTMVIQCSDFDSGITYNHYYLFTKNKDILKDNKIIKKNEIDFSKYDKEHMYATNTDAYDGEIVCLNKSYFKTFIEQYAVHNMCAVDKAIKKHEGKVALQLYTNNRIQLENEIQEVFNQHQIIYTNATDGLAPVQIEYLDAERDNKMNLLLGLAFILVLLLYLLEVLKSKRRLMVYRLHGISSLKIVCIEYVKHSIINIIVFSVSILLFMYIQSGTPSVSTMDYYQEGLKYILYFILFIIFTLVITYAYIQIFISIKYLKTEFRIKHIAEINIVLKLVIICLLLAPLTTMILDANTKFNTYIGYIKNKDTIENISTVDTTGSTNSTTLFDYLNVHNGMYVDFYSYYTSTKEYLKKEYPDMDERELSYSVINYPFILVNANYLDSYDIKTSNGDLINLHTLTEDVILVPEKYKSEDITKIMYGDSIDIIYIENGSNYMNLLLQEPYVLNNPVIRVIAKYNGHVQMSNMCINTKNKTVDEYKEEFRNIVLSDVEFQKQSDMARLNIMYLKEDLKNICAMLILYILFILIVVYQTTYLYINENQKQLSIEYMNGISFIERYIELFAYTCIAYLVIAIVGFLLVKATLYSLMLFILCSLLLEIGIELLLIYRFERKNIANILKGEVF